MNKREAARIVEESLARPSSTPNIGDLSRDDFLEREREELRRCLIEPFQVTARPDDWAMKHAGFQDRAYDLVAVARSGTRWLLYDPPSQAFYKARGESEGRGSVVLLGFYSNDALAEWNG
jgi:hypothetical protein